LSVPALNSIDVRWAQKGAGNKSHKAITPNERDQAARQKAEDTARKVPSSTIIVVGFCKSEGKKISNYVVAIGSVSRQERNIAQQFCSPLGTLELHPTWLEMAGRRVRQELNSDAEARKA